MEISLNDLGVIITAGASGIGLSIAKKFIENGARVYVCDVNEQFLKACVSMKTFVTPEEVADMILFLCSKAGSKISGQAIGIDGNIEILR